MESEVQATLETTFEEAVEDFEAEQQQEAIEDEVEDEVIEEEVEEEAIEEEENVEVPPLDLALFPASFRSGEPAEQLQAIYGSFQPGCSLTLGALGEEAGIDDDETLVLLLNMFVARKLLDKHTVPATSWSLNL
jgi:hypothetical protein